MITEKLNIFKSYHTAVERAAEILKNGGTVAIPTETVYGLAASAYDKSAVEKIFIAKGRPQDNPLIVHIASIEKLYDIAENIPEAALKCAEKYWPGPLTMIFRRTEKIPSVVSAGLNTVAVRIPLDKTARAIIEKSGLPLAAPSANTSGKPSPTKAQHVIEDMAGRADIIIDGGDCEVGLESTVITLCKDIPMLLRPGGFTYEKLCELLGKVDISNAVLEQLREGQ
jgi:L-threonylcarbamoyladenylate synthase